MTPRPLLARALAAAATLMLVAAPATADTPERGDFDARPAGDDAPPARAQAAQEALRDRLGRFGVVSTDERTDTPRAVAKLNGFLTGPSARDGAAIVLGYVRDNPRVFGLDAGDLDGLRLVDRTFTGGVEHLRWEQRYRGIPSSDTQLDAAVTGAGRLISVTGPAAADLAVPSIAPAISAEQAYATVRRSGRTAGAVVAVRERQGGAEQPTQFADGGTASLVLYQDGDGARLAWRVLAPVSATEVYDATVDATTRAVVRRANRVDFAAEAWVYPISPEHPRTTVTFPDEWLPPATNRLKGPHAHAFVDPADHVGFGSYLPRSIDEVKAKTDDNTWKYDLEVDSSSPADGCAIGRRCTWDRTEPYSWQANRGQSATQLFYFINRFHDHLALPPISFGGAGFSGDDAVLGQAMDGADGPAGEGVPDAVHVNNASFLTLPDGTPGLLQSHLFSHVNPVFGDYDAANDASVIYHEYTHGLTNRLVTDAQGFGALNTAQAGAIGEGTSDYYAMDFLVGDADDDDDPVVEHRVGRYLDGGNPAGMRYQAIDCDIDSVDDLCQATDGTDAGGFTLEEFGDVHGAPEVHSDGEIWAQTLWDVRQALGVEAARRLITGGLRKSPPEPSFLDMRNAILASSISAEEEAAIWDVFAARGMGYFASTDGSTDIAPVADFTALDEQHPTALITGTVRDEENAPVKDAQVGIAGHNTRDESGGAVGPLLADDTGTDGKYVINAPEGEYPLVTARKSGFREDRAEDVVLPYGGELDFTLVRDWSSAANGATIERADGPNNTDSGCGPGGLIDDQHGTVWGTDNVPGGKRIVIDLGAPVELAGVAIDPGAGCGDDPTAGLKDYAISGSLAPDGGFQALASGAFGEQDGGRLNDIALPAGKVVRYLELHAKTPQSDQPGESGAEYLDVAELHVAKDTDAEPGPTVETGAVLAASTRTARLAGTVNPHGATVQTRFEYRKSTDAAWTPIGAAQVSGGHSAVTVTRDLSGLTPATTYRYRFVAVLSGVAYPGAESTFTTAPPVVTPTPTPTPTATPTPVPPDDGSPAVATAFKSTRLSADRRGMFKVRWTFGDAAPTGKARISVVGKKRKRIATATIAVKPGRTITKTLRLTKAGRRMIKPGRSLRVTLELRLPGGGTLRDSVRLTRKR